MPGNQFQQEAEVKAVLASNVFKCAPSISQILAYVCERHFAGEVEKIKEYNIAVEALGRESASPRWNRNPCFTSSVSACRNVRIFIPNVVQTLRLPELILNGLAEFSTVL